MKKFGFIIFSFILLNFQNAFCDENILKNGGFEEGLLKPWGLGQYAQEGKIWQNFSTCQSTAELDEAVKESGLVSLHIINPSARAANVYGTMVQRIPINKNTPYRVALWAKANDLASFGAVSIVVDEAWGIRPIVLPAGTYSWKEFSGVFSLPKDYAEFRIISEDKGEVWIDDIRVVPIEAYLY